MAEELSGQGYSVRAVVSNQTDIYKNLEQVVRKYATTRFLRPIADHTRGAFESARQFVKQFYQHNVIPGLSHDVIPGLTGNLVVLDSGCGTGESTLHLARKFPDIPVIGIDKSAMRLNKAGNIHQLDNVTSGLSHNVIPGLTGNLERPDSRFRENDKQDDRENDSGIVSDDVIPGLSHDEIPGLSHNVIPGLSHDVIPGLSHNVIPGLTGNLVVLDSGCGTGESTLHLARKFPDIPVIGIDKSAMRLNKAGNIHQLDNVTSELNRDVIPGLTGNLERPDSRFRENDKQDGRENDKRDGHENDSGIVSDDVIPGLSHNVIPGLTGNLERPDSRFRENDKQDGRENDKQDGHENDKQDDRENDKQDDRENDKQDDNKVVPRNVFWVRAELLDFWRLALEEQQAGRWHVVYHAVYYPNPWPKESEATRRFHLHPIFPTLMGLGDTVELRTNWEIYAREFKAAAEILAHTPAGVDSIAELECFDPECPETAFERKYKEARQQLWRVLIKK